MKLSKPTAVGLAVALAAIFGLALFGDTLGLDPEVLDGVKAAASSLAAIGLAAAKALLSQDADGNGVPDVLESGEK